MFSNKISTIRLGRRLVEGGFTLLEMAIVLMILGIVVSGSLLSISQYVKAQRVKVTQTRIDFVMNVLSAYVQTHDRLPCPGDPNATPSSLMGHEGDSGKCFLNTTNSALYAENDGIIPWKELGIPEDMALDGWGNYITYRPAPNLTVDTTDPNMQDISEVSTLDIHNACRTAMWYDSYGKHINRAKALFCCNAQPTSPYLTNGGGQASGTLPTGWRQNGVLDTTTANGIMPNATSALPTGTVVQATNNWVDAATNANVNGTFSYPNYDVSHADAPLLRATGPAVVLISHGGDGNLAFLPEQPKTARIGGTVTTSGVSGSGIAPAETRNAWPAQMFSAVFGHPKVNDGSFDILNGSASASDDIVSYLRTDQIFGKVGGGSCEFPPNAIEQAYTCVPQVFTNPSASASSSAYGLQTVVVPSQKYELRTNFVQQYLNSNPALYANSLGFYMIDANGNIEDVTMLANNVKTISVGTSNVSQVGIPGAGMSVGVFIVGNGNNINNYSNMDMSNLQFLTTDPNNTNANKIANVNDQTPPKLYAVDPTTGAKTLINSDDNADEYHLNANLNTGQVSHILDDGSVDGNDTICTAAEGASRTKVGINKDLTCGTVEPATAIQSVGVDSSGNKLTVGFEDEPMNCYELTDGTCKTGAQAPVSKRYKSATGGYVGSVGDNTYDDVTFKFSMTACPSAN